MLEVHKTFLEKYFIHPWTFPHFVMLQSQISKYFTLILCNHQHKVAQNLKVKNEASFHLFFPKWKSEACACILYSSLLSEHFVKPPSAAVPAASLFRFGLWLSNRNMLSDPFHCSSGWMFWFVFSSRIALYCISLHLIFLSTLINFLVIFEKSIPAAWGCNRHVS